MPKIIDFAKTNLKVASHVLAMDTFRQRVAALHIEHAQFPILKEAFTAALDKENADYKADLASQQSAVVSDADNRRDRAWGAIHTTAKTFSLEVVGTPEQTAAASIIMAIHKKYAIDTHAQLADETAKLRQAIDDLKAHNVDFSLFGLQQVWADLQQYNDVCYAAIQDRQDERAYVQTGINKANRIATDEAYQALVDFINAYQLLFADAALADFIVKWNSMVNYYRTQMLNAKPSSDGSGQVDIDIDNAPSVEDGPATDQTPSQDGGNSGQTPTPPSQGDDGSFGI